MNQKKCPKCGEMNPGEAVMCWACYTPLTGAVGVGAGGSTVAVGAPAVAVHDDEGQKKAIAPWQLGVVGLVLLAAAGLGFKAMSPSEPVDSGSGSGSTGALYVPGTGGSGSGSGGGPAPAVGPAVGGQPGGGGGPVGPVAAPYTMVSAPNGNLDWAVAAIVPTQPTNNAQRAVSIAAFARRTLKGGNWKAMHIYVFADSQSAQTFNEHQIQRKSDVLQASDYATLTNIWGRCIARYEYNGGKETYSIPSQNPSGWWLSSRR